MRKIFLLLLVSFSSIQLNAQVPGYLGKKLSVGYDFHFFIGGIDPDARKFDANYSTYQSSLFINNFHEVHADYVLSKVYSLGVSYQSFKTGQFYHENEDYYDLNGNIISYVTDNYLNMTCSAIMLNNKFFFFNSGSGLAPVGNYGQLSIGVVTAHSKAKARGIIIEDLGTVPVSEIDLHQTVSTPVISAGMGSQSVLFDRIIIDAGFELAFLPGAMKGWLHDDISSNYSIKTFPVEENAQNAILTRLQTFYVSSVKVGVGILLF